MAKYESGHAKTGGRGKNVPNKRTTEMREYSIEKKASPAHYLIDKFAAVISGEDVEIAGEPVTKDDVKWIIEMLMPYLEGKRKPVDSKGDDSDSLLSLFLGTMNVDK